MSYWEFRKMAQEKLTPQQRMQDQISRIDEVLDRGVVMLRDQDPTAKEDLKQ